MYNRFHSIRDYMFKLSTPSGFLMKQKVLKYIYYVVNKQE